VLEWSRFPAGDFIKAKRACGVLHGDENNLAYKRWIDGNFLKKGTIRMISIQDFKNTEMVVAKIVSAEDHPNADRLYVLKITTGTVEKQLVAGIRASYTKEQLVGRLVIIVNNLEPAVIRGVESQGMVLAVGDEKGTALLAPDREVPLGSMVR